MSPWSHDFRGLAQNRDLLLLLQLIRKSIELAIESEAFDDMERVLMKRVEDRQPDIRAIALELLANFQVRAYIGCELKTITGRMVRSIGLRSGVFHSSCILFSDNYSLLLNIIIVLSIVAVVANMLETGE